jgi:hypothetical protein
MFEQLTLHTPKTFHVTSEQDLNPRPCTVEDHPSVLESFRCIPLWETCFCQSLGVPIPVFLENPRQCPSRQFSFDHYGDHIRV